ncbi:MAG TPA: MFS transporter [Ktedonobacterales bacterium]
MRDSVPANADREGQPAAPGAAPPAPDAPGGGRDSPWRRLVRLAAVDIGPLRRHRDFRLLYAGQMISFFGSMITSVAVPYQAYALTHSPLAVGLFGIVQLVPLLFLAFLGGALADAFDRRRLVQITELSLAGSSGVLLLNALLPHPFLWLLYVIAGLAAGLDALQRPSLNALLPRLVERDELAAAGALNGMRSTFGMVAGPAVAGLLIAGVGLPTTYALDVVTFAVSLVALRLMRAVPPPADAERPSLRRVAEGLRYARSRPELLGTYIVDIIAMFFGMPTALFPALALQYARAGSGLASGTVLGFLYAAPAVGMFLAEATSGWTGRVHRHGIAVILAAGAWGLAITGMGLAPSLFPALVCLAAAGAADAVSGIFRGVIWNQTIPDALRGRLAGIEMISYSSGPLLGDVESGAVATAFSLRTSILSGGILCVVGVGLAALLLPAFRRYDERHAEHGAAVASAKPAVE